MRVNWLRGCSNCATMVSLSCNSTKRRWTGPSVQRYKHTIKWLYLKFLIYFIQILSALQLQQAQQAALEKNNVASATKEELETTKLRVESLSTQLQQHQKDVSVTCHKNLKISVNRTRPAVYKIQSKHP